MGPGAITLKRLYWLVAMVHAWNSSMWVVEEGGSCIQGQTELSQRTKKGLVMVHWVKVLATDCGNPGLSPSAHMMEGEKRLPGLFTDLYTGLWHVHRHTQTHTHTTNCKNILNVF